MKRIDKIYRDKPSAEELYEVLTCCCDERDEMDCCGDCKQCAIDYLNEKIPEYDAKFIEKLQAVKLLFPKARYLTMNSNKVAYIHDEKPEMVKYESISTGTFESIGNIFECISELHGYSSDWENSLIDINEILKEE